MATVQDEDCLPSKCILSTHNLYLPIFPKFTIMVTIVGLMYAAAHAIFHVLVKLHFFQHNVAYITISRACTLDYTLYNMLTTHMSE